MWYNFHLIKCRFHHTSSLLPWKEWTSRQSHGSSSSSNHEVKTDWAKRVISHRSWMMHICWSNTFLWNSNKFSTIYFEGSLRCSLLLSIKKLGHSYILLSHLLHGHQLCTRKNNVCLNSEFYLCFPPISVTSKKYIISEILNDDK